MPPAFRRIFGFDSIQPTKKDKARHGISDPLMPVFTLFVEKLMGKADHKSPVKQPNARTPNRNQRDQSTSSLKTEPSTGLK